MKKTLWAVVPVLYVALASFFLAWPHIVSDVPKAIPQVIATSTPAITTQRQFEVDAAVYDLIQCESNGKNVKEVDSNGYYSYGILQFQQSTWDSFSRESGIVGNPMNEDDSILMAKWAIIHGYGYRWTCWQSLPVRLRSSINQDISP